MNPNNARDIAPGEERVYNDIQEDCVSPQPQRECDEITNNVFLPRGGHFIRVIGEDYPVYVTNPGPAFEPMDETPYNESQRVPRYSRSLIMQPYNIEQNRYESFRNVWSRSYPVTPDDLARAGFKYFGSGDRVKCVFCNGILSNWEVGDNPWMEHKKHFPFCPFVQGHNLNNVPYERHIATIERSIPARIETTLVRQTPQQKPKHPQFRIKSERLVTFNDWPTQIRQKPEDLAEAGLFYLGHGDKVKCFICDGMLHSWEPDDEPWIEHAKWFPDCEYIKLVKGEKFIEGVGSGRITSVRHPQPQEVVDTENTASSSGESVENLPAIKAVLDQGNTMEQIKKAFANLGIRSKEDIPKADKILQTIMLMEEEKETDFGLDTRECCTLESENTEYSSLMEENRNLKEQRLCKICLEKEVTIIFLPCGHVCCCAECSMSVQSCPICRKEIERRTKAFLS